MIYIFIDIIRFYNEHTKSLIKNRFIIVTNQPYFSGSSNKQHQGLRNQNSLHIMFQPQNTLNREVMPGGQQVSLVHLQPVHHKVDKRCQS